MYFGKDMQKNATPVGALAFSYGVPVHAAATPRQMQARAAFAGEIFAGEIFAGESLAAQRPAQTTNLYRATLKQMFDLTVIILAAPLIVPFIALLALMVAIDGGNPFYRQTRVGLGGRHYTMWKMRTMVANADAALTAHLDANPAAAAEWHLTQKLKDDPRITRIGRLLRKSSLDELPQLLNVFRGEMSLVGPRPMLPEQQDMYPGTAYYKLLPGITGPWQVSARNETSFAARAHFDSRYERSVSFIGDLKMLASTVRVVARATGY